MLSGENVRYGPYGLPEVNIRGQRKRMLHYSYLIVVAFVCMSVALTYVWSHVYMTELEYQIAAEMGIKERLLEEQRKLKVELATLKAPKRIEAIAKGSLGMIYPEREQIVFLLPSYFLEQDQEGR